jgi:pimeloyl-ACP methyl ester carboxylesterase
MGAGDASQFIRSTVRVGDLTIAYLKGGRGEPLVYLHGLSGWGRWESYHIALGITNMVYAVQLPGWQDGVVPSEIKSVRDYANLMVALFDELDLNAVDLVAHSFGGWIALYLATEYPSRISRLVLADAMGLNLPEAPAANLYAMDQESFLHAAFAQVGTVVVRGDFGGTVEDVRKGQEFERQWRSRTIIAGLLRDKNADPDLTGRLKAIAANTLVVWGRDDRIVPWQHGEVLARMIPRSKFALIEGASHTPMRERRETFQRVVRDFLIGEDEQTERDSMREVKP